MVVTLSKLFLPKSLNQDSRSKDS